METLKQPQLGKTILELRQGQNLTQEELVERCNLNVRTLQRIEAGEVTPRGYTIKTIFTALDYDIDQIESSLQNKTAIKQIHYGWIAGIIYFILGILETVVDYARFDYDLPFYFPLVYTIVKTITLVSFTIFMLGFLGVGKIHQNPLLKISAYLMIGSIAMMEVYDIVSIFSEMRYEEFLFIKGMEAVAFGGIDIAFGIALFKMGSSLGTVSKVAGIFEIVLGACFVTFILAFLGLFLLIPATVLEIIILYKCYNLHLSQPNNP